MENDREDRADAIDDVRFAAATKHQGGGSSQWDPAAIESRLALGRPIITENRLPVFCAQVSNDGRQSKPSIVITALDNGTTKTAEYFQGRIRAIEYDSSADIAYDTARECQILSSRGFYRVTTDYCLGSTRQTIKIKPIENQFSVLFGPHSEYDCSDAEWCFVIGQCSPEIFEQRFGKETTYSQNGWFVDGQNPAPEWIGVGKLSQEVQFAEYWLKVWQDHTVCRLNDGTEVDLESVPEGAVIVESRVERRPRIMQYIMNGVEILDETEWIGSSIPIVPVWGKQMLVDGKRRAFSLIRYAKDPQRLLNLYVSNMAEQIAQMPKSPWLIAVGAVQGFETLYQNANIEPTAYLPYNQRDSAGNPLERPTRIVNEPPIQAMVAGYNQCVDAIKATMGLFDASLGGRSNETSGIAIKNRAKEADNANFHLHDNEARSRKTLGRIVLELLIKLETEEQTVSVRGEDGKTKSVRINTAEPYMDPATAEMVHHLTQSGNYGAAVSTGPGFANQMEQAYERDADLIKAAPELMFVIGDQLFAYDQTPGGDERADRMKRYINMKTPGLIQDKTQAGQQVPPAVAAKMQQMQMQAQQSGQLISAMTEHLNKLQADITAKNAELQVRLEIAQMQERTKREIGLATIDTRDAQALLLADLASVKHRLDLRDQELQRQHEAGMQQADMAHKTGMAQQAQDHASGMAEQQQGADADAQDSAQQAQSDQQDSQQAHAADQQDSAQSAQADAATQAQEAAAAQPPAQEKK